MSHKKAKRERKLLRQKMKDAQTAQFSFSHLENYIALHQLLTGKKPESITLTPTVYTWFIQESQRHAETLNLNLGFKDEKPMFAGVSILKDETPKVETATELPK